MPHATLPPSPTAPTRPASPPPAGPPPAGPTPARPRRWTRYAFAAALAAAAFACAAAFAGRSPSIPILVIYLAVVLSALYGGFGPGLLAAALGFAAARLGPAPGGPTPGARLFVTLLGLALLTGILIERIWRLRARVRSSTAEARALTAELERQIEEVSRLTERLHRTHEYLLAQKADADRANERLGLLERLGTALAQALTERQVARTVLEHGAAAIGARTGAVARLEPDGSALVLVHAIGVPAHAVERLRRIPLDEPMPIADAARSRGIVLVPPLDPLAAPRHERTTDERTTDERTTDERTTDERTTDERTTNVRTSDQRISDALISDVLTADERRRPLDAGTVLAAPIEADGRLLGVLAFGSDRHGAFPPEDRDLVVAFSRQCAQALERARLYDAERRARAEAQHANRVKSQFLAVMSHELRTPLNAIIGYQDLLESGISGPLTGRQREQLGRVRESAWHLLELIDQILTLSHFETGRFRLKLETCNVGRLIHEAAAGFEPFASRKGLRLTVLPPHAPISARTDGVKLRQILKCLLSNALKFTDTGEVRLHASADESGTITIRVQDTGIGIPTEHLDTIFAPFHQVDQSSTREHGGTGLGLPVARHLARILGGDLSVDSTLGAGSVFTLTLPPDPPAGPD